VKEFSSGKMGKFSWGERATLVTYSSDEYVILTKKE